MGSEHSICACYDGQEEKNGESDIYKKKNITKEHADRIGEQEIDNMYSMAFSGAGTTSAHEHASPTSYQSNAPIASYRQKRLKNSAYQTSNAQSVPSQSTNQQTFRSVTTNPNAFYSTTAQLQHKNFSNQGQASRYSGRQENQFESGLTQTYSQRMNVEDATGSARRERHHHHDVSQGKYSNQSKDKYKESTGGSKLEQVTLSSHGSSQKQLKSLNNQLRNHQFKDVDDYHKISLRQQNSLRESQDKIEEAKKMSYDRPVFQSHHQNQGAQQTQKFDHSYQAKSDNSVTSPKQPSSVNISQKQQVLGIQDYKSFKKMKDIQKRYVFGRTLGQGAFGQVKLCMHQETGKVFAIKIMTKKAILKQDVYVKLLQNELEILGEKSHPNLIRIVDLIEDNDNYYIVSEVVKGGELFKRLSKLNTFTECQAADIIYQVMRGLNYLHQQKITHRDMKPENILLVSRDINNLELKIADLGFAQKFDPKTGLDLVLGTPLYMAPELIRHQKYNEKVDVWSLGVITHQLLCGRTPFDSKTIKQINENICRKKVTFQEREWKKISNNAKDFITRCLERNFNDRPSIAQLFDHPWICEVPEANDQSEEIQLDIQKNLIEYQQCSEFQKMVLSLCAGLSATQDQLEILQREFLRLDKDKNGTLCKRELEEMTSAKLVRNYDFDWDLIIEECDYNGDGVIDFQEFMCACIDRQVMSKDEDLKIAFRLLDTNKDGVISLDDFDDLFNSYGGAKMDSEIWDNLLDEADKNGDGVVSFAEFKEAMASLLKKGLNRKRRKTDH